MNEKIRIDEVFCQECFFWFDSSKLHKDKAKSRTAILDWLLCPKDHVVGIMAHDPSTPIDDQLRARVESLR